MLLSLRLEDFVIVDTAELAFGAGFTVLSGETGAGKSILLDALGLVLGWRGRADTVRPGREAGEVTAVFDLPGDSGARAVLAGAGIEVEEGGDLILRRVAQADGRRQAFANDRRVSAATLRELSAHLVELHGGRIWLDSVPGEGTTVFIMLPAAELADAGRHVPEAVENGALRSYA